ncbi:hypothetical protein AC249_AIPGENE74 [Exaiptasia diaphana]|nr:hypothetical protein AC249_AIPGENE74 [Exaiptasia diaphana]
MTNNSSSDSEMSVDSDDSEYNYIPGTITLPLNYDIEYENDNFEEADDDDFIPSGPYEGEPLADEAWLQDYKKKKEIEENLRNKLQERLDDKKNRNWCLCGHCSTDLLENIFEARCCQEIERCVKACNRDDVLVETKTAPRCITLHPGFRPVCLEKWSLKQSASKYKTRDQRRYTQIGKESTFLRAVAYREFSQLVYGFLGSERIPLPACTYHKIRAVLMVNASSRSQQTNIMFNSTSYEDDVCEAIAHLRKTRQQYETDDEDDVDKDVRRIPTFDPIPAEPPSISRATRDNPPPNIHRVRASKKKVAVKDADKKKKNASRSGKSPKCGTFSSYLVRHLRKHQWSEMKIKKFRKKPSVDPKKNSFRVCPVRGCGKILTIFKAHFRDAHHITKENSPLEYRELLLSMRSNRRRNTTK